MIAALYVESKGVYSRLPDVDLWDVKRDARNYAGPYPVVAHPPCNLWVNLARVNFKRYGKSRHLPGNDGGCFAHALSCVRMFGGVLEHPAFSHAWEAFALPRPVSVGWTAVNGCWICEVWQSAYGHKARKRTWLYYVGPDPDDLLWDREPGEAQVGWFDRKKPTLSKRDAKASPERFARALVSLARNVHG